MLPSEKTYSTATATASSSSSSSAVGDTANHASGEITRDATKVTDTAEKESQRRSAEGEEDYADVPETPLYNNKDEEEELMMRRTPQMKRKRPLTRQTVKREERNVTAPMIEVSGPDGPMMVFRPWTALEARESMAHLPDGP
ncbi:hypothetical protein ROHU_010861 [Labeo rohita]|uniref:Uncharacterized protein n=1 Tax=Labeo rohita TaxID=84645 RepID=A0A498LR97_LABRO|nr:hypothetical protein ROHU_010861 [Labeo rohita]